MLKQNSFYKFTFIVFFYLFSTNETMAVTKSLTCATTHYPPYTAFNEENKTFSGIDMDIVKPLFKQLNYQVNIVNLPWARLKEEITKNTYDCYFSLAKIDDRENYLSFTSTPTHITTIAIFYAKQFNSIDFTDKTVGVHRGIGVHEDVMPYHGLHGAKLYKLPSNEILFQMLHHHRVDAVVTSKVVGEYILKTQYSDFNFNSLDIGNFQLPVYIAFKKGAVDINIVNQELEKIITSSKR